MVVNNLAVLDSPGEYVCTEHQGLVTFSWIPPAGRTGDSLYSVSCSHGIMETRFPDNFLFFRPHLDVSYSFSDHAWMSNTIPTW